MDLDNTARRLGAALRMRSEPIAISFHEAPPAGERFEARVPSPTADGRTGKVSAGCVFWVEAGGKSFWTAKEDHANCSVGSFTHGFLPLEAAGAGADVGALVESGWVAESDFGSIEHVLVEHAAIGYGPLAAARETPEVVLLMLSSIGAMIFRDALPEARIEGKPQCHIIAIAKERNEFAISFGCMLSRTRTGMPSGEMTAVIPGRRLAEALERIEKAAEVDKTVAAYASVDAQRFDHPSTIR